MTKRDAHGVPVDPEAAANFWRSMARHDVPRARRSKPSRPVSIKPPKCDVCGKWFGPGVDHSECAPPS